MNATTEPWIVLFPGMTADAPVYASEAAAQAMVERTNQETAGNVEAVAMPLRLAVAAGSRPDGTMPSTLSTSRTKTLLRELGESE